MRRMISVALFAVFLTHCATSTVTRGPMQRVRVTSKPKGATVALRGCGLGSARSAKTPAVVFVNRRATRCTLTFTHPDYGSRSVTLARTGRLLDPAAAVAELATMGQIAENGTTLIDEAGPAGVFVGVPFFVAASVAAGVIWGGGKGIDALSAANYRQNRSTVAVDFTKPAEQDRVTLESEGGSRARDREKPQ